MKAVVLLAVLRVVALLARLIIVLYVSLSSPLPTSLDPSFLLSPSGLVLLFLMMMMGPGVES